jgi:hypothetical protein
MLMAKELERFNKVKNECLSDILVKTKSDDSKIYCLENITYFSTKAIAKWVQNSNSMYVTKYPHLVLETDREMLVRDACRRQYSMEVVRTFAASVTIDMITSSPALGMLKFMVEQFGKNTTFEHIRPLLTPRDHFILPYLVENGYVTTMVAHCLHHVREGQLEMFAHYGFRITLNVDDGTYAPIFQRARVTTKTTIMRFYNMVHVLKRRGNKKRTLFVEKKDADIEDFLYYIDVFNFDSMLRVCDFL